MYTWAFPEIGVPANHPKDNFCIETPIGPGSTGNVETPAARNAGVNVGGSQNFRVG